MVVLEYGLVVVDNCQLGRCRDVEGIILAGVVHVVCERRDKQSEHI